MIILIIILIMIIMSQMQCVRALCDIKQVRRNVKNCVCVLRFRLSDIDVAAGTTSRTLPSSKVFILFKNGGARSQ
jgi:hypothetical protein